MTNFLQFDPVKNNMQSDALYQASSFRAQGAQTGIASASAHNKLFYQLSTMMAAIAQMMEGKGYEIDDTAIATLVTELSNIMTRADMSAYALNSALAGYVAKEAVVVKTASHVLTTADFYKTLEANSASAITFTLPGYASVPNGGWVKIKNIGAGSLTISGIIDGVSPSTELSQWDEITVFNDGNGYRGSVISRVSSISFDASLTTNGYQKLPNGLIIQWASFNTGAIGNEYAGSATFPIAFPTDALQVVMGSAAGLVTNATTGGLAIKTTTKTGFTYISYFSSRNDTYGMLRYIAIGY